MGKCSIVILTYNAVDYTKMCYQSIIAHTNPDHEIIFVDNGSKDGTLCFLYSIRKTVSVIRNRTNQGFAKGCNQGAAVAKGDTLLFLNNDTIVTKNWLDNLLFCLNSDPTIGVVAPASNFAAGASQLTVPYRTIAEMQQFAAQFNIKDPGKWVVAGRVSGFCLLIKRHLFQQLNGFDEQFAIGSYEDADLTQRVSKSGYQVLVAGDTFIHHFGNRTYQANQINLEACMRENALKFHTKHPRL
jgi:GT2 family glycosyltransferase